MMGSLAFVAQRIEHLTTDQKVGGSSPSKRTRSNCGPHLSMVSPIDVPLRDKSGQFEVKRYSSPKIR